MFANSELAAGSFANDPSNELIAIRGEHSGADTRTGLADALSGEVFDLSSFAPKHAPAIVSTRNILKYGGIDASALFPVQVSALCQGVSGSINPFITLDTKNKTEENAICSSSALLCRIACLERWNRSRLSSCNHGLRLPPRLVCVSHPLDDL